MKYFKKKSIIFCIVILTIIILSGIGLYVHADQSISNYSISKIANYYKNVSQNYTNAEAYKLAHPNEETNSVSYPMESNPNDQPELIPFSGWEGISILFDGPGNVSTLWLVGDLPDYQVNVWEPAYVYSGCLKDNTAQGFIAALIEDNSSNESWTGTWNTPGLWGSVTITSANINTVSFTTTSGVSGTFSLNTHVWSKN